MWRGARIAAGCVRAPTDSVVGLSNVFGGHPFGNGYELASRDTRVVFVSAANGLDQQTFTDRFAAMIPAREEAPALTVEQKNYAALMDVTYSLGAPPVAGRDSIRE